VSWGWAQLFMLFILEWHFLREKKGEMTHPKETGKQIHIVNFFKRMKYS